MQTKSNVGSPTFLRISKMLSNKTIMKSIFKNSLSLLIGTLVIAQTGCTPMWQQAASMGLHPDSSIDFAASNPPQSKIDSGKSIDQRYQELAGLQPTENTNLLANGNVEVRAQSPQDNSFSGFGFPTGSKTAFSSQQAAATSSPTTTQATSQSADQNQFSPTPVTSSAASQVAARLKAQADDSNRAGFGDSGSGGVTTSDYQQSNQDTGKVKQVAYQYPELATPDRRLEGRLPPGNGLASPNIGSPNELNPLIQPFERGGNAPVPFPANYADLDVYVAETETGSINFGGAYNSDNGIVGQFKIDERNFDIFRWPTSFRDLVGGTAFRGGGQQFSLELVPGQNLQRYSVSLTEPYLLGTDYSLSVSGYLFERRYFDYDEQRLGGRVSVGRRLTPDLSISLGFRGERVGIDNLRVDTSPTLNDIVGKSNLFLFNAGLIRDTRDSQLAPTEGTYMSATLSQAFGDFDYTRGDFDFRTYRLLYERADGTGRHTISYGTKLGFSGSSTPVFENYFAGGFSTFRGFDFRGVGPSEGGAPNRWTIPMAKHSGISIPDHGG